MEKITDYYLRPTIEDALYLCRIKTKHPTPALLFEIHEMLLHEWVRKHDRSGDGWIVDEEDERVF